MARYHIGEVVSVKGYEYVIENFVGGGAIAEVYRAYEKENHQQIVALKVISEEAERDEKLRDGFRLECELLDPRQPSSLARHVPDLLPKVYVADPSNGMLVTEFVEGVGLDTLQDKKGFLEERVALRFIRDLLKVLFHLHRDVGRTYTDLQLKNIKWVRKIGNQEAEIPPEQEKLSWADIERIQVRILDWNTVSPSAQALGEERFSELKKQDIKRVAQYLYQLVTGKGVSPHDTEADLAARAGERWHALSKGTRWAIVKGLQSDFDTQRFLSLVEYILKAWTWSPQELAASLEKRAQDLEERLLVTGAEVSKDAILKSGKDIEALEILHSVARRRQEEGEEIGHALRTAEEALEKWHQTVAQVSRSAVPLAPEFEAGLRLVKFFPLDALSKWEALKDERPLYHRWYTLVDFFKKRERLDVLSSKLEEWKAYFEALEQAAQWEDLKKFSRLFGVKDDVPSALAKEFEALCAFGEVWEGWQRAGLDEIEKLLQKYHDAYRKLESVPWAVQARREWAQRWGWPEDWARLGKKIQERKQNLEEEAEREAQWQREEMELLQALDVLDFKKLESHLASLAKMWRQCVPEKWLKEERGVKGEEKALRQYTPKECAQKERSLYWNIESKLSNFSEDERLNVYEVLLAGFPWSEEIEAELRRKKINLEVSKALEQGDVNRLREWLPLLDEDNLRKVRIRARDEFKRALRARLWDWASRWAWLLRWWPDESPDPLEELERERKRAASEVEAVTDETCAELKRRIDELHVKAAGRPWAEIKQYWEETKRWWDSVKGAWSRLSGKEDCDAEGELDKARVYLAGQAREYFHKHVIDRFISDVSAKKGKKEWDFFFANWEKEIEKARKTLGPSRFGKGDYLKEIEDFLLDLQKFRNVLSGSSPNVDYGRLRGRLEKVVRRFRDGDLGFEDATREIKTILNKPPKKEASPSSSQGKKWFWEQLGQSEKRVLLVVGVILLLLICVLLALLAIMRDMKDMSEKIDSIASMLSSTPRAIVMVTPSIQGAATVETPVPTPTAVVALATTVPPHPTATPTATVAPTATPTSLATSTPVPTPTPIALEVPSLQDIAWDWGEGIPSVCKKDDGTVVWPDVPWLTITLKEPWEAEAPCKAEVTPTPQSGQGNPEFPLFSDKMCLVNAKDQQRYRLRVEVKPEQDQQWKKMPGEIFYSDKEKVLYWHPVWPSQEDYLNFGKPGKYLIRVGVTVLDNDEKFAEVAQLKTWRWSRLAFGASQPLKKSNNSGPYLGLVYGADLVNHKFPVRIAPQEDTSVSVGSEYSGKYDNYMVWATTGNGAGWWWTVRNYISDNKEKLQVPPLEEFCNK